MKIAFGIIIILSVLYTGAWFGIAKTLDNQIQITLENLEKNVSFEGTISKIYGFPTLFKADVNGVLELPEAKITGGNILINFIPLPKIPSEIIAPGGFIIKATNDIEERFTYGYARAYITHLLLGNSEKQLRGFKEKDGEFILEELLIKQENASLKATGEVSLDSSLQPQGTLEAQITGFPAIIRKLREYDVINSDQANMASIISLTLARQNETGQPYVAVPLFLNNQELYLGPILITKVPVINLTNHKPDYDLSKEQRERIRAERF